jgi:hypothetical protein
MFLLLLEGLLILSISSTYVPLNKALVYYIIFVNFSRISGPPTKGNIDVCFTEGTSLKRQLPNVIRHPLLPFQPVLYRAAPSGLSLFHSFLPPHPTTMADRYPWANLDAATAPWGETWPRDLYVLEVRRFPFGFEGPFSPHLARRPP